ncbi:6-phosphogluconate dehydrogenase, decarboxylating [Streptomyces antimycoticus]
MGSNLARNFTGATVALHNRTFAKTKALMEEHGHEGNFVPADAEEFVASLQRPRRLIIMVKAGAASTPSSRSSHPSSKKAA